MYYRYRRRWYRGLQRRKLRRNYRYSTRRTRKRTFAIRQRRKYDNCNVSFKDIAIYRLEVKPEDQDASVSNARYFRDGPKMHPLKNSSAQSYFGDYKWVKINHVSYYWYGFIICYNIGFNIPIEQIHIGHTRIELIHRTSLCIRMDGQKIFFLAFFKS